MNLGKREKKINEYCWTDLQLTIYSKLCVKRQLKNRQNKDQLTIYSKPCVKWQLKNRQNIDLNDKLELNECEKFTFDRLLLTCIM